MLQKEYEIEMTPYCMYIYHQQDYARHKPYVLIMICSIHMDHRSYTSRINSQRIKWDYLIENFGVEYSREADPKDYASGFVPILGFRQSRCAAWLHQRTGRYTKRAREYVHPLYVFGIDAEWYDLSQ